MSSDEKRVSADDFARSVEPIPVEGLKGWDGSAWPGDVGAAVLRSARFGHTEAVIVHGDTVLSGHDRVQAERHQPQDGGTVPAVDLAALGLSWDEAKAYVLAHRTGQDRDRPDPGMLAELVIEAREVDAGLALAAGWDGDSIDALMAAVVDRSSPLDLGAGSDGVGGLLSDPPELSGGSDPGSMTLSSDAECPSCGFEFDPKESRPNC